MSWKGSTIIEIGITALSWMLRLIPDRLPGKARFGRTLLRPMLSRRPAVLKDRGGRTYVLPSYAEPIAQHIFTFGAYERDTQNVILKFLTEAGIFIDVGANIGTVAIPIAKARPYASIICVEADPRIQRLLRHNLNRNGCGHVRVVSCIAGATDGRFVAFYRAPDDRFGMGSVGPQFTEPPIMLEERSLDRMITRVDIHRVDVIKMDVEGAELGVLRGANRLLTSERPPTIILEFSDWAEARIAGQQPGDAQALLLAKGYRLFRLEGGGRAGKELLAPMRHGSAMLLAVPPRMQIP
jgi:FkbM family methyltransferase